MAKMLYSATMSLDGFIAGPGGDMSWLTELSRRPNPTAEHCSPNIGCLLVGGRTFRGDDPNKGTDAEGAFGGQYHGPVVVLTRPAAGRAGPGHDLHRRPARGGGARRRSWRATSTSTSSAPRRPGSCLAAGLLDEILMLVAPVLLGDGVRVFDHPGGTKVRLEQLPDATALWYRVVRG